MAKKLQKKNSQKVLAIDLGGTKLAVAVVDRRGHILELVREAVELKGGFKELVSQISRISIPLIRKFKLKSGAIAAAGPLDPIEGTLLNPTNLKSHSSPKPNFNNSVPGSSSTSTNGMWGKVFLIREVEKELAKNKSILKKINPIKIKLCLENDAAAAVLAESWIASMAKVHKRVSSSDLNLQKNFSRKSKQSATQSAKNIISVTLGTGLGVGVIANGKLVRSGQNLHPEAGHIIISYNEKEWLCGCGNFGCAEAFLSGVNWTNHLAKKWNEPKLTSEQLVIRARKGDQKVLAEFDLYAERLAAFFTSLIVLFSPQKIIISGGFSHAAELFLPKCETKLIDLLRHRRVGVDLLPAIECSKHPDDMGVLGAAYVALMFQK